MTPIAVLLGMGALILPAIAIAVLVRVLLVRGRAEPRAAERPDAQVHQLAVRDQLGGFGAR